MTICTCASQNGRHHEKCAVSMSVHKTRPLSSFAKEIILQRDKALADLNIANETLRNCSQEIDSLDAKLAKAKAVLVDITDTLQNRELQSALVKSRAALKEISGE